MTDLKHLTVIVADDHAVVRQSLCALLHADGHFMIVGKAENGRQAVEMARILLPDVILMDISMPVLNGLEATRQILGANSSAKVIILSAYNDDEYIERARAVGAAGMLAKQTSSETLTKTIREIVMGRGFFSPSTPGRPSVEQSKPRDRSDKLMARTALLTPRESEVLHLLAGGAANKHVAIKLHISITAVEKHLQQLMGKLKIEKVADLARFAIAPALIENCVPLTLI